MDISRRRFLLTTVAAGVAPLAMTSAHARDLVGEDLLSHGPIDLLIYDERFNEAARLARRAARERISVSAVRGDVTQLWYDGLYHRWQRKLGVIAGLTTVDALFCLETLGAEVGLQRVMSSVQVHSGLLNDRGQPMRRSPLVSWLLAPPHSNFGDSPRRLVF